MCTPRRFTSPVVFFFFSLLLSFRLFRAQQVFRPGVILRTRYRLGYAARRRDYRAAAVVSVDTQPLTYGEIRKKRFHFLGEQGNSEIVEFFSIALQYDGNRFNVIRKRVHEEIVRNFTFPRAIAQFNVRSLLSRTFFFFLFDLCREPGETSPNKQRLFWTGSFGARVY